MPHLIQIVEHDANRCSEWAMGLVGLNNVEVVVATTLSQGRQLIDRRRPDLLISGLQLPDGSGIELLSLLRPTGRRRTQVIFISPEIRDFRHQIPHSKDILTFADIRIDELQAIVRKCLALPILVRDSQPFSLDEYLQIAVMGRHSVLLEVSNKEGEKASFAIWKGRVCAARDLLGEGEEAFARICFSWIRPTRAALHHVDHRTKAEYRR